jgi:AbrB family looped-hinge helix DNA binding protein
MRITSKGQVTIPQEIREKLGLWPHTEVEFIAEGNSVYLQKTESNESRGSKLVSKLRGKGRIGMSTDQILELTRGEQE